MHATAEKTGWPRQLTAMLVLLIATGTLSQFYRSSNAVIAPELIRDLGLSSQMLGLSNSAFFLALLALQVPLGLMFDRIGVRRSVALLSLPMTLGAALHALADSGTMLVAARFLVGLGCAGSFMASVVLVPRFVPRADWSRMLGLIFASSQAGYFLAGTPLAFVAETVGWRRGFLALAIVSAIVGIAFGIFVRDRPDSDATRPATPTAGTQSPSAAEPGTVEGIRRILTIPGIPNLFALFGVAYAAMFTVIGLWIGPYLKDIHDLDAVARGHVLLLISLALVVANLIVGHLERLVGSPKRLVMIQVAIAIAAYLTWAAIPQPPLWLALTLVLAIALASSYGPVILAQIRARVPDNLAGRGATTANFCQLLGTATLPVVTGLLPPLFAAPPTGGYAADAYRAMFAVLGVVLACGWAAYARLPGRG